MLESVSAVILNKEAFEQADINSLQQESVLFQSIGMGIAISLAKCDGVELCELTVNEKELNELINALDKRIEVLTLKQEAVDNPDEFQQVLIAYVNTRDNFGQHMDKLKTIKSDLDIEDGFLNDSQLFESPDFPVESARNVELLEYVNDLELFKDEEITDDESEWDLPPLPDELEESINIP